jgi:hypothetical protein
MAQYRAFKLAKRSQNKSTANKNLCLVKEMPAYEHLFALPSAHINETFVHLTGCFAAV